MIGRLDELAIHFDAAAANPLTRLGARTDSGLGEDTLQGFERALAGLGLLHCNSG
jgi:hypothetical protein